MKATFKKIATGILSAALVAGCIGVTEPVAVSAASNKALKLPVSFSGKNSENEENHYENSTTESGFDGGELSLSAGDTIYVSYVAYVPKQVLKGKDAELSLEIHPNYEKKLENGDYEYLGEIFPSFWYNISWWDDELCASYWDEAADTGVKIDACTVTEWGDYYKVEMDKYPMKGLCDGESQEPIEIKEPVDGRTWINIGVTGDNTKISSFVLIDDVAVYKGDQKVVSQDFSSLKDVNYRMNSADEKQTKCVAYTKNLLKLAKTSATIKKGKKVTIKATASPAAKITYKSSNKKVATVTSKGVVKGIKAGKTTITVKANGMTKKFKVTVKK